MYLNSNASARSGEAPGEALTIEVKWVRMDDF